LSGVSLSHNDWQVDSPYGEWTIEPYSFSVCLYSTIVSPWSV